MSDSTVAKRHKLTTTRFSTGTASRILVFCRTIAGPTSLQIYSKVEKTVENFRSTSDRELCCLEVSGTSSGDEEISKHVLACEQLAGDGFCRTNTASGVIVEIVLADAFYAFVLE